MTGVQTCALPIYCHCGGAGGGGTGSGSQGNGDDSGAGLWWIAVLVVGLCLVLVLATWFHRHNRKGGVSLAGGRKRGADAEDLLTVQVHGRDVQELPALERSAITLHRTLRVGSFGQMCHATPVDDTLGCAKDASLIAKLWQLPSLGDEKDQIESRRRFIVDQLVRESRILHQFNGEPHIATVYGLLASPDSPMPVGVLMECCTKGTLADLLEKQAPPMETKLRIAYEIASGMRTISEAGAMHMELAACNVMLTGEDYQCKLMHLGRWVQKFCVRSGSVCVSGE